MLSDITHLNDHCRIGSLENHQNHVGGHLADHCRIGSLEIAVRALECHQLDHCRIGSLEIERDHYLCRICDHCRIGSLEMNPLNAATVVSRSLPHRQLRNHDSLASLFAETITAA